MNIHFTDRKLFDALTDNTVVKVKIGSHMYILNDGNSDIDYLYIYLERDRSSFLWEHHQLQFKEDGIDHNFTTLQGFIRNVITGDATINFEVLHSLALKNSMLGWLWEKREYFYNYNIIKSYLGLARRDHKHWMRETWNGAKHDFRTNKKATHFVRGVISANNILNGCYSNDFTQSDTFNSGVNDYALLRSMKNGLLKEEDFATVINQTSVLMEELNKTLNALHDRKEIAKFMAVDKLQEVDAALIDFAEYYATHLGKVDYGDIFYKALEESISY